MEQSTDIETHISDTKAFDLAGQYLLIMNYICHNNVTGKTTEYRTNNRQYWTSLSSLVPLDLHTVLWFIKLQPLITDVRSDVSDLSGVLRLGLISLSTYHLSVSDWMPWMAAMTDIKGSRHHMSVLTDRLRSPVGKSFLWSPAWIVLMP